VHGRRLGGGFVVGCMDVFLGKRVKKTTCAGEDDKYSIDYVYSVGLHIMSTYRLEKTS